MENQDLFILYSQNQDCGLPSDVPHQGISSPNIDQVIYLFQHQMVSTYPYLGLKKTG